MEAWQAVILSLITAVAGWFAEYFRSRDKRAELRSQVEQAKATTAATVEEVYLNSIKELTETWRQEVERYAKKLESLEAEVQRWRTLHSAADESRWAIEAHNRELLLDVETLRKNIESKDRTIALLEEEARHWQEEVEKAESRRDSALQEIKECEKEKRDLKKRLELGGGAP